MPGAVLNYTTHGWPLLDLDSHVDAMVDYTIDLADKLENADADVAAAVNAAVDAQAAAASVTGALTDIAAHGDLLDLLNDDTVTIGGIEYPRTGAWSSETLGTPAFSASPIFAWTLTKPRPYAPPAGYGFAVHLLSTNGFTCDPAMASTSGSDLLIRVVNINSSSPLVRLGWRLVKV